MKRTPLKRKTPMKRSGFARKSAGEFVPRKPMKKAGRKTLEWAAMWRKIKPALERAGIIFCEVGLPGCWRSQGLTPAHSLKRRHCVTPALLAEVCLACIPCHNAIELKKEPEMAAMVRSVIQSRIRPLDVVFA